MSQPAPFPPQDEYMHEPTDHPQFNESMYFNFVDGESGFATLIRMGNRVNEGHAEVTVLLYLPGGGAAIHFERAPISDNSKFDAGGLRFEVIEPLQRMRVTYSGDAHVLERGTDLDDPKKAFTTSPVERLELTLDYENVIPVYGLEASTDGVGGIAGAADSIATGHYQGPCRVSGTVQLAGKEDQISGLGFRDHSWGPRVWQGPKYWRWVSGLADERNGFVGWVSKIGDERPADRGMVLRDGEFSLVKSIDISSDYGAAPPHFPEGMDMTLHTESGSFSVKGEASTLVPLRHRREGAVARLAELVCRYEFDGMVAYGISEYHDLMLDGVPAGLDEV
jgi:hypothetical protein